MQEITSPSFGRWLRQRRKALDLTQEELAERISCSSALIRKIEAGQRGVSKQVAEALADFLGVTPDERLVFLNFARGVGAEAGTQQFGVGPQRSIDVSTLPTPTNLPAQLTPLIGRESEAAQVHDLLLREGVRLLTLTGPPGIGKTSLAIEVAGRLLDGFDDGVFFVALAPINDPDLVAPTIAQVLGLKESADRPPIATLTEYLRHKSVLLVLDNFEQILDAGPRVVELLQACPQSKVLITSREALHVRGERQFAVPPLPVPEVSQLTDLEAVSKYPAVELFVERAQSANPNFALTHDNAGDVAAVCIHLDGLPLAMELAAARTNILTLREIRTGLDNRFTMLSGGWRDLPPRHRTLRHAIGWSYNLLNEEEQALFRRLGVFVGGCTKASAEAVCNATGDIRTGALYGLASLVDKSLMQREEGEQSESRFEMLEMIRAYAAERLGESGEMERIKRLHAEYHLAFAEAADIQLRGPEQAVWLDRLDREHANMRAVLDWAEERGEVELCLRLAASLGWFWEVGNHSLEGVQRLKAALAKADDGPTEAKAGQKPLEAATRARALAALGRLISNRYNKKASAIPLLQESLMWAQQAADHKAMATALHCLGNISNEQGDYATARMQHQQELVAARELGDPWYVAWALMGLGHVSLGLGDYETATATFEETLAMRKNSGDRWGVARSLRELGTVAQLRGDYATARRFYEESLATHRELGQRGFYNFVLPLLGEVAYRQGDYARAIEAYRESLILFHEEGFTLGVAQSMAKLAVLMHSQGHPQQATLLLGAAQALRDSLDGGSERGATEHETHEHAVVAALPYFQTVIDRDIADTRAQLDADTWQKAWQEGHTMSMEQAIVHALEGDDPPATG